MRRLKYICYILVLSCFCGGRSAIAQEQNFTLADCVKYAEGHNSSIHLSDAEVEVTKSNYRDAIARLLPEVTAGTSAYVNYGRGIDPRTNTYTNVNSFRNNYNIEGALLLFDGLSSIYALKGQRTEQMAAIQRRQKASRDVQMSTIEAYYNLLYTKDLKKMAEEHLRNSTELCQLAEKMYALGMKAPADVAEAKATMAKDKLALIQQTNNFEIALLQLKAVMNYPIEQALVISDSLTYGEVSPTLLRSEDLFPIALKSLPEALLSDYMLKSSLHKYQSSKGAFSPRINLFAGFNTGFSYYMDGTPHESYADQLRNRRGSYIGVSLTFDLFSGTRKLNEYKRSKAQYFAQQKKHEDEQRQIYKDIQEAILNLNAAVEEYKAAEENATHLKQVYEATRRNYQVGHASSIDLSVSTARYKEAQAEVAHKYTMYLLRQEWLNYYAQLHQ